MISSIILESLLAASIAGLSVPAIRSMALGDIEHDWLAGELDLSNIEPDGQTIATKGGQFIRVFKLRGATYDAKVIQEQKNMLKVRGAMLHAIGEHGCTARLFAVKRQHDISFDATWPNDVLKEIGDAERDEFQSSYYVDWYLVPSSKSMYGLVEATNKIMAMAGEYKPVILTSPDDESKPCPLTCFANYLVSGDYRNDLPAVTSSMSGSLPASSISIDKVNGLIVTHTPNRMIQRVIAIRKWSETVNGTILGEILAIKGDIEISHICEPRKRDQDLLFYSRAAKAQQGAFFGNSKLADEYMAFVQLLTEGNTTLFNAQLQIVIRAETEELLNDRVNDVCKILGKRRVLYSVETAGAPTYWFNRIPGERHDKQLRPLVLRDMNIAALWPYNYSPAGMTSSPFGQQPLRYFHTPSGMAYAMQFHVSAKPQSIGNFMMFGPSGGGKSTFLMHLFGGMAKFKDVRSYIFDSKEGARFMVEAMGGIYQGYNNLQLNPLDVGEDTPQNRHRVYMVLKAMAAGVEITDDDEAAFNHAVELAFSLNPPDRTLNAIYEYAFAKRTGLRKAFARWVTDGKGHAGLHSHVFNAPHDSLGGLLGASHMVAINMNEALDDPVLGPPVVSHISAAISKSAAINSKGFCIFIDEAAKLLPNDGFRVLAMEMYREYRKLNGAVGMAFQDPAALFRTGVAEAFLENTATLIFLPNSQASRESLVHFNLNEEQINFICGSAQQEGARQALIVKRDAASGLDESAILDIDLNMLGDALRHYRAGTDANKHLADLKRQWGDQWQRYL